MSKFSDNLSSILKANDVSVYSLSKCSGVARTSIYKYLDGRTLPKRDFLESIVELLCLSTRQKKELFELYSVELYGEDVYLALGKFREFISSLNKEFKTDKIEFTRKQIDTNKSVELLDCPAVVQFYLRSIIESEISRTDRTPTIDMVVQPSYKYLNDLLYSYAKCHDVEMEINQIISFEKKGNEKVYKKENLDIFNNLLVSSIVNKNISYNVNYYYEQNMNENNFNKIFPYFVIADNKVLFISHDYETGMYINDANVYKHCKHEFTRISEWSNKFLKFEYQSKNILGFMDNNYQKKLAYTYSMAYQPCLAPFFNLELFNKYVDKSNPAFEMALNFVTLRLNDSKSGYGKMVSYFTLEGLDYFCDTGIILELPKELGIVVQKEDRLYLLKQFYHSIEKNIMEVYVVDKQIFEVPKNVIIDSYEVGYIAVIYKHLHDESMTSMIIYEKGTADTINYFFEDMRGADYIYNREKTLLELDKRIKALEAELM